MPSLLLPVEHGSYSYMAFGSLGGCFHSFPGGKAYKYLSAEAVLLGQDSLVAQSTRFVPWQLANPAPCSGRWPLHPGVNAGHLHSRRKSLASANESCCLHVQYI